MRHVMLDLETLGTRPGSVIAAIAAVAFDPTAKLEDLVLDTLFCNVDVERSQRLGLTIEAATVSWWLWQDEAARRATFPVEALPPETALCRLSNFLKAQRTTSTGDLGLRLWAKPTTFDPVLLEAAYHGVGLAVPWHRRETRDVGTLLEVAGVERDALPFVGTPHHALDDALHQAKLVAVASRRLSCQGVTR